MIRILVNKRTVQFARFIAVLVLAVTLGVGAASAGEPFTPDETKAIEKILRDYILKNPEIIKDAAEILGEKQEAAARDRARRTILARKDELFKDPASPVDGNPSGDVTIVEFFDYQCGYCKRVFPRLQKLLADDGNLRFVFKEFPILGRNSVFAARAALAARKQGEKQYVAFHKVMMASKGGLSKARVFRFAMDAGLDIERLKGDMEGDDINEMIRRNLKLADTLTINGTPAFVIGDTIVRGAAGIKTLKSLVERARKTGFSKLL